jgi:hypothetical protein
MPAEVLGRTIPGLPYSFLFFFFLPAELIFGSSIACSFAFSFSGPFTLPISFRMSTNPLDPLESFLSSVNGRIGFGGAY